MKKKILVIIPSRHTLMFDGYFKDTYHDLLACIGVGTMVKLDRVRHIVETTNCFVEFVPLHYTICHPEKLRGRTYNAAFGYIQNILKYIHLTKGYIVDDSWRQYLVYVRKQEVENDQLRY